MFHHGSVPNGSATLTKSSTVSVVTSTTSSVSSSSTTETKQRKQLLASNPELLLLHHELVSTGIISDAEFWEARKVVHTLDLLENASNY